MGGGKGGRRERGEEGLRAGFCQHSLLNRRISLLNYGFDSLKNALPLPFDVSFIAKKGGDCKLTFAVILHAIFACYATGFSLNRESWKRRI